MNTFSKEERTWLLENGITALTCTKTKFPQITAQANEGKDIVFKNTWNYLTSWEFLNQDIRRNALPSAPTVR